MTKEITQIKIYKSAPLPFQGQKRFLLQDFLKALDNFPDNATYVDLFGGSGLLSHNIKRKYPKARVIYNDYDNFQDRLKNIPNTNAILEEIRALKISKEPKSMITGKDRERIIEILEKYNNLGYVDWISITASLLFSGKYATCFEDIKKENFYNKIRTSPFPLADDYLQGIEVVRGDYSEIYNMFKQESNAVFIFDPPYLSTDTKTYRDMSYWKLKDYLDITTLLEQCSYFYFTSEKSQIVELCNWIGKKSKFNPFDGANLKFKINNLNSNARYKDLMYWRIK